MSITAISAGASIDTIAGMDDSYRIGSEAFKALANAINTYTFAIVADGTHARERRGLGTGIGISWKDHHLIITAAHTLQTTPVERLGFFLPFDSLQIVESLSEVEMTKTKLQRLKTLDVPKVLLETEDEDLAAILLPKQSNSAAHHFYAFDESARTPQIGDLAGYLGYPDCRKTPFGENFSASPFCCWGELRCLPPSDKPKFQIAVDYSPAREDGFHNVDPHGISGSGIWTQKAPQPPPALWTPTIELAGIVIQYWADDQILVGYTAEAICAFLRQMEKEGWL